MTFGAKYHLATTTPRETTTGDGLVGKFHLRRDDEQTTFCGIHTDRWPQVHTISGSYEAMALVIVNADLCCRKCRHSLEQGLK